MAIGVISSPASWALGTVASPTWFQNVQDSVNGWYAGTNSFAGLAVDGTGGLAVAPGAGNITASAAITAGTNITSPIITPAHIVSGGTTIVGTLGPGLGSGAGLNTVSTTDLRGKIQVTCGSTPSASAVVVTMTFNTNYAAAPFVVLAPANASAAALSGTALVYVSSTSTSNFVLSVGSTPLTNGTTYQWYFVVIA